MTEDPNRLSLRNCCTDVHTTTFGSTVIDSFVYSSLGLVLFVYGSFPSWLDGFGFQPVWKAVIGNANSIACMAATDGVGILGLRSKPPKPFLPIKCGTNLTVCSLRLRAMPLVGATPLKAQSGSLGT